MSARVETRGLGWTPLGASEPVLDGLDLRIDPGERVLLAGASGSGKSTLLRALAGLLDEGAGDLTGEVRRDEAGEVRVGLLLQDPRDARVAERVDRDVAFGPENAGLPRARLRERIDRALTEVGFPYGPDRSTSALSGGQAQRLALAGVVALRPGLLLLDEPTSMLDPAAAAEVRAAVLQSIEGTDTALVVVEHRLDGWIGACERLVVLGPGGHVVADGRVEAVLASRGRELAAAGVWVPGAQAPAPLDVPGDLVAPHRGTTGALVRAENVGLVRRASRRLFGGPSADVVALAGVDARVEAGAMLGLRGASGAGKSSLLDLLLGLAAPSSGHVVAETSFAAGVTGPPHRWASRELAARSAWVPQRAGATIVGATVADCLAATGRALRRPEAETATRSRGLADALGLGDLLDRHPHRLSGGQTRRLAVASALVHGPGLLGLDEPTVGQDRRTWAAVAGIARSAAAAGVGVVVSTHDDDLAEHADAALSLVAGRIA